ncbi:hypothetical protein M3Y97_00990000 [Aphelenchoides bicaudatus]|nr:hypothetical protein M3Y97_00990000 [Aphelenchoides bicaudatus]
MLRQFNGVCRPSFAFRLRAIRSMASESTKDPIKDAEKLKHANVKENVNAADKDHVTYALKEDYPNLKDQQREGRVADAYTGLRPTPWQKRVLVWTQLYKSQDSIPEYVPADTMSKMNNRMRGYIVLTISVVFTTIWIVGNTKIQKNREQLNNAVAHINASASKSHTA